MSINKIILIICVFTTSCRVKSIENDIINDSKNILRDFNKKSVLKSRGKNYILFSDYLADKKEYSYDIDRQLIATIPDTTKNLSIEYQTLKRLISIMDSLNIDGVNSDFPINTIDIKFYLKSGKSLIYVKNINNITNTEWIKYLSSIKKINRNWYIDSEE